MDLAGFLENPWVILGLSSIAGLIAGLIASRVTYRFADRASGGRCLLGHALRQARGPFEALFPLISLGIALHAVPGGDQGVDLLRRIDIVLVLMTLTFGLTSTIDATVDWVLSRHDLNIPDNLAAWRVHTKTRVLSRSLITLTLFVGISTALMTFPAVRKVGISLLASAGAAGLVIGLVAKAVLGNLAAGLQIPSARSTTSPTP